MSDRRIDLGPTGETVRENVKRLREEQNLTYAELSRRLEAAGNPIPPLGLRRMEAGERRVHVDDLIALAVVFGRTPVDLLAPYGSTVNPDEKIQATGIPSIQGARYHRWLMGGDSSLLDPNVESPRSNPEDFHERVARIVAQEIRASLTRMPPETLRAPQDDESEPRGDA